MQKVHLSWKQLKHLTIKWEQTIVYLYEFNNIFLMQNTDISIYGGCSFYSKSVMNIHI